MKKEISVFEASYWAYYYNLSSDEFWSMILSNDINLEELSYFDNIFNKMKL